MFEEEKLVGDLVALPHLDELLLEAHAVLVSDDMQVPELTRAHERGS
jgi:hypothetical protein